MLNLPRCTSPPGVVKGAAMQLAAELATEESDPHLKEIIGLPDLCNHKHRMSGVLHWPRFRTLRARDSGAGARAHKRLQSTT
jgi:hypothetical protein